MNGEAPLQFDSHLTQHAAETPKIRGFADIPDLMEMNIQPVDYLVEGLVARKSMTLWSGVDGTAKTLVVLRMGIAVAIGGQFLGRRCQKAPVIALDYENPDFEVRRRLEIMAGGPIPNFKVWGTWLEQQPPQIGSELLLEIAKQTRPLMIFDPFRYAHPAEENDSTAMMTIMQCLRDYAAAGAAVIILHHPAKTEGSTGRGSTAIRGAVDVAFLQERSDETDLITLKCMKNRFGQRSTVTIRPDWEEYSFEVTDSPQFTKRSAEIDSLRKIIEDNPGLTQNGVYKKSGMRKSRTVDLLKSGNGSLWEERDGGRSLIYFPLVPKNGNNAGTTGTTAMGRPCSTVPMSLDGNREQLPAAICSPVPEQLNLERKTAGMPFCPSCKGFALYKEGDGTFVCETCKEKELVH